jgi:ActR/RegA family two-component response regulator
MEFEAETAPDDRDLQHNSAIIVEDNQLLAIHLEFMLESIGFSKISVANSLSSAQSMLDISKYSVAIIDLNLGDGNGLIIADRCTSEGVPFLISTGYGGDMQAAFKNGEIVLQKPYTMSDLEQALSKTVTREFRK